MNDRPMPTLQRRILLLVVALVIVANLLLLAYVLTGMAKRGENQIKSPPSPSGQR